LDIASPDQQLTAADWKGRAEEAMAEIRGRGKTAIVCGGTGLYIRALLDDWRLAGTPPDSKLRDRLQREVVELGSPALHRQLALVDAAAAERLHPNDAVRIVRALEVYYVTGRPISELQAEDCAQRKRRPAHQFGLALPRPELYSRINRRVDAMAAAGLEAEVRSLLDLGLSGDLGPMRSLGYKEMVQFIRHELSHSQMLDAIKQSTRRYAKRQQTWFHADKSIDWIDVSALNSAEVAGLICTRLEENARDTSIGRAF